MTKPSILEVIKDFRAYLAQHPEWGSLHIVLADGNTADSHVRFCIDTAREGRDSEGERLARILLTMSITQRRKLPFSL